MIIPNRNLLSDGAPKTHLTAAIASGATVYPVKNTAGFTTSYAIQVGETGLEQSEVLIGTVTNNGTITGAASKFEHPVDTPVYNLKFDQVVFERSTVGTSGTATPMTNGTVTYQADADNTIFDDTSGSSSYAYRTYFKNSAGVAGSTSVESDWITSAGFSFYSLARLRERIREKLWNDTFVSDDMVNNWINEWKTEMVNAAISVNQEYSMGTVYVGFGTNGLGTITTDDFKQPRRIWITYDSGASFNNSTKAHPTSFLPEQQIPSTAPRHIWRGDSVFEVKPAENGGTALIEFYRFGTVIVNDTDELPLSLRAYTKSFVDYGLSQAFLKDEKFAEAKMKLSEANQARELFKLESSPRDKSSQTVVDEVEPTGELSSWESLWG